MTGTLVPPWFEGYKVTRTEMSMVSLVWGISLGCSIFCTATAINQTLNTWARCGRITEYIFLIWTEIVVCTVIGIVSWLYMRSTIGPSFEFFFFVLCLWVVQIQVLLQVIVNRVALLLPDPRRVSKTKWTVVAYVGVINVSVFCIWIPAQLQRSQTFVNINHYWDRIEKVLFLLIDAGLNFYFMWLVRKNLIANGLGKYKILFWTNVVLDVISIFLDLAIILSMSFKNPFIYVQFHPLAYIIKLAIEMSLADLIAKVARASSKARAHGGLDGIEGLSSSYDLPISPGATAHHQHQYPPKSSGSSRFGGNTTTTTTSTDNSNCRHRMAKVLNVAGAPSFTSEITSNSNSSNNNSRRLEDVEETGSGRGNMGGITKMVAVEIRRSECPRASDEIAMLPRPTRPFETARTSVDTAAEERRISLDSGFSGDRESQRRLRRTSGEEGEEEEGELQMMRKAYMP